MSDSCPACRDRRDWIEGEDKYRSFKVGRIVDGKCDRCTYVVPVDLVELEMESFEMLCDPVSPIEISVERLHSLGQELFDILYRLEDMELPEYGSAEESSISEPLSRWANQLQVVVGGIEKVEEMIGG